MSVRLFLEPEQKQLLVALAEASRSAKREQRQKFVLVEIEFGPSFILHPGLPGTRMQAYKGDVETLGREGLLAISLSSAGALLFDVTPVGFAVYEDMKQSIGRPIRRIEQAAREYLDSERFEKEYPAAYQKWSQADVLLWTSDSQSQFTTIGHLCREATQEFVEALVQRFHPTNVDRDKAHVVARIKAVLDLPANQWGKDESQFVQAMIGYWGAVIDLAQRQEHGGQKEGESLTWEDARRLVFQTAIVMFEIDRSLSRAH